MAQRIGNHGLKPTHEDIARRAREIYERSGRTPGHDLENWLEAESQLLAACHPEGEHKPQGMESRPGSRLLARHGSRP